MTKCLFETTVNKAECYVYLNVIRIPFILNLNDNNKNRCFDVNIL